MVKKQCRSSANQSTANNQLEVSSPAKKPLEEVASTSKKRVEDASTSKMKNQLVINAPPEPLIDDEEMKTEEEDDETNSSSEEEDETKQPVKTPSALATIFATSMIQSSGSESRSETKCGELDSETEPPPHPPPAHVATPRTLRKRTIEVTASTDTNANKRAKTETEETDNTVRKALFQRVWSEEDEVALLQGLVDFKADTKKNHVDDMSGCYEIVKESEGKTIKQFTNKVGKLKKKYLGKKKKSYTNAHYLKCLYLCKKIWGTDLVKSMKKIKVEDDDFVRGGDGVSDWFERSSLVGAINNLSMVEDEALKRQWSLVSLVNKKKMDEKWKLLQVCDFELLMLKTELVHEVSSAIFNAN